MPPGVPSGKSRRRRVVPRQIRGIQLPFGHSDGKRIHALLTQLGRDAGKNKEKGLWDSWGGKPTTQLLRHRDHQLDPNTKSRYHAKLAAIVPGIRMPSPEEEAQDPQAADHVYDSCVKYLIQKTRDHKQFPLLFHENVSYGFRRDLLGNETGGDWVCGSRTASVYPPRGDLLEPGISHRRRRGGHNQRLHARLVASPNQSGLDPHSRLCLCGRTRGGHRQAVTIKPDSRKDSNAQAHVFSPWQRGLLPDRLAERQEVLFDYAAMRDPDDKDDKRIDLPKKLLDDLDAAEKDAYDVVAFTHLDNDHTKGADDFFHLDHATKYQGEGRIKIETLWVPAAVITESRNDLEAGSKAIQAEARHRLKKGYGVRVFSRPDALKKWLEDQGLTLESRKDFITDAGQVRPN